MSFRQRHKTQRVSTASSAERCFPYPHCGRSGCVRVWFGRRAHSRRFGFPDAASCAAPVQAAAQFFFLGIQLGKVFLFRHCVTSFKISEIVVQTLRRKLSASADCFRCEVGRDRCASIARGAATCTEQRDAKQPGHATVWAIGSAGRTYSRQESIEVRP